MICFHYQEHTNHLYILTVKMIQKKKRIIRRNVRIKLSVDSASGIPVHTGSKLAKFALPFPLSFATLGVFCFDFFPFLI